MIKKNRWWLIAVYCVLAVLVVAIVVSCFVKVSSKPQIENPDYYYIKVEGQAEYSLADKVENKEKYDKINDAFEKSFSEAFLTSLFSGRLSFESKIENVTSDPSFDGYKVKLGYATEQTIMFKGKEYNPPTNTEEVIKYSTILIDITEGEGYATHYIYYEYHYTDSSNVQKTAYYKQSIKANFDDLYNLLDE